MTKISDFNPPMLAADVDPANDVLPIIDDSLVGLARNKKIAVAELATLLAPDVSGYATTGYVDTAISGLVGAAPGALNTLDELATALGDDANYAATVTTALAGKLAKASNLSDLANVATARTNLGVYSTGEVDALVGSGSGDMVSTNNLSDVASVATARTNLDVYSKAETNALIPGLREVQVFNFTGASEARFYADVAMTVTQQATSGTGSVAYEKSTTAAPGTFSSTTSPITLEAGAWLKVTASAVTGTYAVALKRTA